MAKQGDSDAHNACYRLSEPTAMIERGLLGWEEPAAKRLFAGDARSSPPAESGHARLHLRYVVFYVFPTAYRQRLWK